MIYHYFHIRYFETRNGEANQARSAYHCATSHSTIDSLKQFLRNNILKNPDAIVTIFSLQPLERQAFLESGGIIPAA